MSLVAVAVAWALASFPAAAWSQREGHEAWDAGRGWMSMRAGYSKAAGDFSGGGSLGGGIGYAHMLRPVKIWRWTLFKNFSLGTYAHYEVLSTFGNAKEVEVPATVELVRHFRWKTALRPYLGLGTGAFIRKAYRTGNDTTEVHPGVYLTFGANIPVGGRHLLGFDGRYIRVDSGYVPPNPVFGTGSADEILVPGLPPRYERNAAAHWSAKINWTVTY
jgi:hypothetical protein